MYVVTVKPATSADAAAILETHHAAVRRVAAT
jgi:hypothetical protein